MSMWSYGMRDGFWRCDRQVPVRLVLFGMLIWHSSKFESFQIGEGSVLVLVCFCHALAQLDGFAGSHDTRWLQSLLFVFFLFMHFMSGSFHVQQPLPVFDQHRGQLCDSFIWTVLSQAIDHHTEPSGQILQCHHFFQLFGYLHQFVFSPHGQAIGFN